MTEGGIGGDTRKFFTKEQYDSWNKKRADSRRGCIGYWRDKNRPKQSLALKAAHESGKYGNYPWTRKQRNRRCGVKYERIQCNSCGKLISKNRIAPHRNSIKCRGY